MLLVCRFLPQQINTAPLMILTLRISEQCEEFQWSVVICQAARYLAKIPLFRQVTKQFRHEVVRNGPFSLLRASSTIPEKALFRLENHVNWAGHGTSVKNPCYFVLPEDLFNENMRKSRFRT